MPHLFLLAAIISGYTCRSGDQSSVKSEMTQVQDSSYLFDGKTLDGWEITDFGTQGPVSVSGGKIILGMGDGCSGITWKRDFPTVDYEVTLEAMRVDGHDFFCGMTFPVGKDPCTLIVGGWGGMVVGLSSIDGMDASENETMTLKQFENDRWYRIRLRVTADTIQAWIDNEIVVDFTIGDCFLSIRPEVELSKPFGIASWRTTAAIKNIRIDKR
ncbi:MAG: hypothetical protein A2Y71_14705 [Bacteroidetes bacterium RBG_13_42_15]|nr:MAG: hypothetical protein A2Y71_14705 [Bacteroidetes bacterium RBG_13_42_15]